MLECGQAALEQLQEEWSEKAESEKMALEKAPKDRGRKGNTERLYPSLSDIEDSDGESTDSAISEMDSLIQGMHRARIRDKPKAPSKSEGACGYTPPTAPPPYPEMPRGTSNHPDLWREVQRELSVVCPVFVDDRNQRYHEPLDFKNIKSIAESVRTYGVTAAFTITQVESLHRYCMTPTDWLNLARACLSPGQYLDWRAYFTDYANEQATRNAAEGRPWNADMLLGQGNYATQQTAYEGAVYPQINMCAIRAWKSLTGKGETSGNLTKILQGPMEPFADFVARMVEAATRVFGDTDATKPFIKQLIYEQCTKECRVAINPHRQKGLETWIRACREIGGPLTNAGLAAAVLQLTKGKRASMSAATCFKCGKPGHMRRNCPLRGNDTQDLPGVQPPVVPGLCPKCKKGRHWARECRSVKDIHGQPIPIDSLPKKRPEGPSHPGPANIWGNGDPGAEHHPRTVANSPPPQKPRRATAGSAGLDLRAATRLVLTPQVGVQLLETDFAGPLNPDTVGLLIGRSSTTLRGLRVHPGIIDPDFTDNHYPKDNLLLFITHHPVIFPKVTAPRPLMGALDIYTDGSKTGIGAYVVQGQEPVCLRFQLDAPQIVECQIVCEVFKRFREPFNLISDSHYVVNAGKRLTIKMDNGPAYTSKSFQQFCLRMQVRHVTGLPYNPQGQGIVERANRSLKELLQKQKGGIVEGYLPKNRLSLALFTLNFLNLNEKGFSAASRHSNLAPSSYSNVKWKDVLNNQWHGPDPVISRSRGAVCVFPQDQENPIWVPERLARVIHHEDPAPDPLDEPDSAPKLWAVTRTWLIPMPVHANSTNLPSLFSVSCDIEAPCLLPKSLEDSPYNHSKINLEGVFCFDKKGSSPCIPLKPKNVTAWMDPLEHIKVSAGTILSVLSSVSSGMSQGSGTSYNSSSLNITTMMMMSQLLVPFVKSNATNNGTKFRTSPYCKPDFSFPPIFMACQDKTWEWHQPSKGFSLSPSIKCYILDSIKPNSRSGDGWPWFQWLISNEAGAVSDISALAQLDGVFHQLLNVSGSLTSNQKNKRLSNITENTEVYNITLPKAAVCIQSPFIFLLTNVTPNDNWVACLNNSCFLAECWNGTWDLAIVLKVPTFVPIQVEVDPKTFPIMTLLRERRDFGITAAIVTAIAVSAVSVITATVAMANQSYEVDLGTKSNLIKDRKSYRGAMPMRIPIPTSSRTMLTSGPDFYMSGSVALLRLGSELKSMAPVATEDPAKASIPG
ncbi:hypothetical protein STEG23_030902 [Scotinomys teguina]